MPDPDAEARLDENALASFLASENGWVREGGTLTKTYKLGGFNAAVTLVNEIAKIANAANHHPDLHIEAYRRLRVVLTTHSHGGISDADVDLARRIDQLAATGG